MNRKIKISAHIPCALELEVNDDLEVVRVNRVTPVDVSVYSLTDHLDRDAQDELDLVLSTLEDEVEGCD